MRFVQQLTHCADERIAISHAINYTFGNSASSRIPPLFDDIVRSISLEANREKCKEYFEITRLFFESKNNCQFDSFVHMVRYTFWHCFLNLRIFAFTIAMQICSFFRLVLYSFILQLREWSTYAIVNLNSNQLNLVIHPLMQLHQQLYLHRSNFSLFSQLRKLFSFNQKTSEIAVFKCSKLSSNWKTLVSRSKRRKKKCWQKGFSDFRISLFLVVSASSYCKIAKKCDWKIKESEEIELKLDVCRSAHKLQFVDGDENRKLKLIKTEIEGSEEIEKKTRNNVIRLRRLVESKLLIIKSIISSTMVGVSEKVYRR